LSGRSVSAHSFSFLTDIFVLPCSGLLGVGLGLLLASLSRRTIWFNVAVFFLVLLFVQLQGGQQFLRHSFVLLRARDMPGRAVVFGVGFYRVLFQFIIHAALVLVPSVWGMRQSLRWGALPNAPKVF
jgi:hypothetical protein